MKEALKLALEALEHLQPTALTSFYTIGDRNKAVAAIKEALAQDELCSSQEPVAYLVTGPYEKQTFTDINSANSYCNGLNKGFGEAAYSVSLLYTTPPKQEPRNFCPRCGKRTADLTVIHTCTPPEGGHQ